ncbi:hypothetical protein MRX96_000703 [Rhipicephalus microplus]
MLRVLDRNGTLTARSVITEALSGKAASDPVRWPGRQERNSAAASCLDALVRAQAPSTAAEAHSGARLGRSGWGAAGGGGILFQPSGQVRRGGKPSQAKPDAGAHASRNARHPKTGAAAERPEKCRRSKQPPPLLCALTSMQPPPPRPPPTLRWKRVARSSLFHLPGARAGDSDLGRCQTTRRLVPGALYTEDSDPTLTDDGEVMRNDDGTNHYSRAVINAKMASVTDDCDCDAVSLDL